MDKKIAGLIGAVTALSAGGAMAAAPVPGGVASARSFAELLQPIPDATARLAAADAASHGARNAQLAQYYDRDRQDRGDREDIPPIVREFMQPNERRRYHHHHHHHHNYHHHHHHHHHRYYDRGY